MVLVFAVVSPLRVHRQKAKLSLDFWVHSFTNLSKLSVYNLKKHAHLRMFKIGMWSLEGSKLKPTKLGPSSQTTSFVTLNRNSLCRSTWKLKQIANNFCFLFPFLICFVDFQENYNAPSCKGDMLLGNASSKTNRADTPTAANNSMVAYLLSQGNVSVSDIVECNRASSLLFLLLMFGTVWIGVSLYNFNKT